MNWVAVGLSHSGEGTKFLGTGLDKEGEGEVRGVGAITQEGPKGMVS